MRPMIEFLGRVALLAFILAVLWWASNAPLSKGVNLSIIVGGVSVALYHDSPLPVPSRSQALP
jgi:hypothetical protein